MRRHAFFLGFFVIITGVWLVILLRSQTHVHSDEAIIGLMGKHILEGRYFPFYMYGQPYNAGGAWEAYLAAIAFALFGVGVVALKGCIVALSLLTLFLFYRMCIALYDQGTAVLATIVFGLAPSLLKWHFQVRGYSWYFLSIPVMMMLFTSLERSSAPKGSTSFLLGLVSALTIWSLELGLPLVAAFWLLLLLGRRLSWNNTAAGFAGFVVGYAPVVAFNLAHGFSNWRYLSIDRPGGGFLSLLRLSAYGRIFLDEMPKFFGPDTVLWYYPGRPVSGYVFYSVAVLAVGRAFWPFAKSPTRILRALCGDLADVQQKKDFDLLILTAASFVPYLSLPVGVPSYFLGGCFFLSALTGRMLDRLFASSIALARFAGAIVLGAILVSGTLVLIKFGQKNEIETLSPCEDGKGYCMTRISGADMENVEMYLKQHNVTSVWTTISFVYPLLFESRETLAVSNAIFEYPHRVYPASIPWREPEIGDRLAVVVETDSPFRAPLEERFLQVTGVAPLLSEYGKLSVIEKNTSSDR